MAYFFFASAAGAPSKAEELRRAGRRPYVVRPFGLDKLVLGAVDGAEIERMWRFEARATSDGRQVYLAWIEHLVQRGAAAIGCLALGLRLRQAR